MKNTKKLSQQSSLTSFLTKAENFALITFEKTSHTALEGLRKELRKAGAVIKVVKNAILLKSINKLSNDTHQKGIVELQKLLKELKQNTAVISLGKDWSNGLNAFAKFIKTDKTLSFKFGFLDALSYDSGRMEQIAKLPSKAELLGKIIGSMKSPTSRLVYALKFPTQKLTMVLSAKSKK